MVSLSQVAINNTSRNVRGFTLYKPAVKTDYNKTVSVLDEWHHKPMTCSQYGQCFYHSENKPLAYDAIHVEQDSLILISSNSRFTSGLDFDPFT